MPARIQCEAKRETRMTSVSPMTCRSWRVCMMSCVNGGKSSVGVEARGWGLNVDMERRWKRWVGAGSVGFAGAGLQRAKSDQNITPRSGSDVIQSRGISDMSKLTGVR
jgi:hypothetical protein